jgi:hypothetical protein
MAASIHRIKSAFTLMLQALSHSDEIIGSTG